MAFIHSPKIVSDGLVFHIDTINTKSYVSGSTNINNLGTSRITSTFNTTRSLPNIRGTPIRTDAPTFNSGVDLSALTNFPELNFTRADNFTMCVWASLARIDVDPINGGTNRGVFARGSYGGFVGIAVGQSTTASSADLYVGTRFSNGATLSIQLKPVITTGSNAEIFNAVLVYRSSSLDGYLNGNYVGTVSFNNVDTTFAEGNPPSYGINAYGGIGGNGGPATMSFYNASIYNRQLTAAEIKQNYEVMRVRLGV